jgi:uncharacterized membrane protein YtjA (UPF0391 family)
MLAWVGLLILLATGAGLAAFTGYGGAAAAPAQKVFAVTLTLLVVSIAYAALRRG